MGQNVNYLLGNQSQMLGADPELYRQQLIQQEQARVAALPAQSQLGATVGGLLGRGIGNLTQGRGFLEVTNPVLQKLTQIQGIYDSSMKEADPNDPMSFYTTLQKNFADAGLGQQSLMAATEAKKFEGVNIKSKSDLADLYAKNPGELDSAIQRATQTGDEKAVTNLTTLKDTIEKKRGLDLAKEEAQINLANAQSAQARAAAQKYSEEIASGKYDFKVIAQNGVTPSHIVIIDKKTGEERVKPLSESLVPAIPGAGAPKPAVSGEKPNAAQFDKRNQQSSDTESSASPATATKQTVNLYDQARQTYKLTQDPEYLQIVQYAQQNAQQIGQDPMLRDRIGQAMKDLQAKRQKELGSFVKFE